MSCISNINRPNCKKHLTYCPCCVFDIEQKYAWAVVSFAESCSVPFLSISLLLYSITFLLGSAWTFLYTILLRHFFCSISASLILQMPHKDRPHGQFCTVRVLFISFSDFPSIDLSALYIFQKKIYSLHHKLSGSRIRLLLWQNYVWTILFEEYLYPYKTAQH